MALTVREVGNGKSQVPFLKRLRSAASLSPRYSVAAATPFGGVVLDIGCGDFGKTYQYVHVRRPDLNVIGIEKALDASIYGALEVPEQIRTSQRFEMRACDLNSEPLPFADSSVDAIYCSHLLEHLDHAGAVVKEMYRVLKVGGTLYLEVPGPRATLLPKGSFLSKMTERFPINHYDDPTHVRAPFTIPELRQLLSDVGFSRMRTGFHREYGLIGMPLYVAVFFVGLVYPRMGAVKSTLVGSGWWGIVGWPVFGVATK